MDGVPDPNPLELGCGQPCAPAWRMDWEESTGKARPAPPAEKGQPGAPGSLKPIQGGGSQHLLPRTLAVGTRDKSTAGPGSSSSTALLSGDRKALLLLSRAKAGKERVPWFRLLSWGKRSGAEGYRRGESVQTRRGGFHSSSAQKTDGKLRATQRSEDQSAKGSHEVRASTQEAGLGSVAVGEGEEKRGLQKGAANLGSGA